MNLWKDQETNQVMLMQRQVRWPARHALNIKSGPEEKMNWILKMREKRKVMQDYQEIDNI